MIELACAILYRLLGNEHSAKFGVNDNTLLITVGNEIDFIIQTRFLGLNRYELFVQNKMFETITGTIEVKHNYRAVYAIITECVAEANLKVHED